MPTRHLIIGNGAAGLSAAEEIRRRAPTAQITMISDEPYPTYSRPGLAYLLTGELAESLVFCRTRDYYAQQRISLVYGRAHALELALRQVRLDDRVIPFDTLLLATGATAVPVTFPGSDLDGIVFLDKLKNVQDILQRVQDGAQAAVVVGGGITAMELAEGLRHRGLEVHYLLRKKELWSALLTNAESRIVEDRVREQGIQIHRNEEIAEVVGVGGNVAGVHTTGGQLIPCQLVGAAIGVRPNLALVRDTPIRVDRGISVDEFLESSVPGVFAAGDVAQVFDRWSGESRIDDLWHSALASGRAAGANIAGAREPYVKGVPFNAARVFGVHIASMGQAGAARRGEHDPNEMLEYQSRGSSEVWWARPGGPYFSAWGCSGDDSLRIVLRGNQIVGAVILGNQDLADPLRNLVADRADISAIRKQLQGDDPGLGAAVHAFYEQWRHTVQGVPA